MKNGYRLWLVACACLSALGCGSNGDICGAGTHASGNSCIANPLPDSGPGLQCGTGTHASGDVCVADPLPDSGPGVQCGPGTTLSNGLCLYGLLPDGGFVDTTSWEANVRVAPSSIVWAAEPAVAVDSKGNVFVASMILTASSRAYGVALYKSVDKGQTFSEVASYYPTGSTDFLGDTTVTVDGSDHVFWAFIHYDASASSYSGEVDAVVSQDGSTFPGPQRVDTPDLQSPFCDWPWLSLAPDGSVYLSWTNGSQTTGLLGSRYAASQSGQPFGAQQTFLDPSQSSAYNYILAESPLAFTNGGKLVAATTTTKYVPGAETPTTTVDAWLSSGSSWSESTVSTLFADRSFVYTTYSIIASDSSGGLHYLYLDGQSHNLAPYLANSSDGSHWSTPVAVDGLGHADQTALPWVTTDAQNNVYVVWLDNRYGGWVPMTAHSSDGVTFSASERIGDSQFTQTGSFNTWIGDFLSMVVRDGWRYSVWTDSREGIAQVYFSKAPVN